MAKGMKHGSGALPLNFKVVGNPQPEQPRENTFWIDTDAPVTGYDFRPTQPDSPSEGMVWVKTGTVSSAEFNAVKKNGLHLCPVLARQYLEGAWVDKAAQIYQGGQWSTWYVKLDLDMGVNNWTNYNASGGSLSESNGTLSISDSMGSSTTNRGVCHYMKTPYDLTDYDKLVFEGTLTATGHGAASVTIGVTNNLSDHLNNVAAAKMNTRSFSGRGVVDISQLTGTYYIAVGMFVASNSSTSIQLTSISLMRGGD